MVENSYILRILQRKDFSVMGTQLEYSSKPLEYECKLQLFGLDMWRIQVYQDNDFRVRLPSSNGK